MASVLLVECQEDAAADIANRLREVGFDVTVVLDTLAAIDVLKTTVWFDILITRVRPRRPMPHGFALARIARDRRPGIGVIYVTGSEVPDAERVTALGAILTAPIVPDDIVQEAMKLHSPGPLAV